MRTKEGFRKEFLQKRDDLSLEEREEKSRVIIRKLQGLEVYRNAASLFTYVNMRSEVITEELILLSLAKGKKVAVPKVGNGRMDFYEIRGMKDLKRGSFGILEPLPHLPAAEPPALLIMPGIAFDIHRNRIGYGGGYYDRYLAEKKMENTVALAFGCQLTDSLPSEACDIRPEMIITESAVYG